MGDYDSIEQELEDIKDGLHNAECRTLVLEEELTKKNGEAFTLQTRLDGASDLVNDLGGKSEAKSRTIVVLEATVTKHERTIKELTRILKGKFDDRLIDSIIDTIKAELERG